MFFNTSISDCSFTHQDIPACEQARVSDDAVSQSISTFVHIKLHSGLIVFSNLSSASVLSQSLVPVFLTCTGSKFATSTRIFLVSLSIPEVLDHITPARAHILLWSAITISSGVSVCSFSNKSTKRSPSFACLIINHHSILSASKKCIGCPV